MRNNQGFDKKLYEASEQEFQFYFPPNNNNQAVYSFGADQKFNSSSPISLIQKNSITNFNCPKIPDFDRPNVDYNNLKNKCLTKQGTLKANNEDLIKNSELSENFTFELNFTGNSFEESKEIDNN